MNRNTSCGKPFGLGAAACAAAVLTVVCLAAGRLRARPELIVPVPPTVAGGSVSAPSGRSGLHIKRARTISFRSGYYIMNDGGGYRWDFQYYGNVYTGTNSAYSGGMYCQINGTNFQATNYSGWANKAGDEIEMGPWHRNGLNVYRRAKVYKDRPMARWLEIFENPTGSAITVRVAIYTCTNYTIQQTTTTTGAPVFGPKDWAFRTRTQGSNSPLTLHVVTSRRAKLRPTVQVQSNQIYVRYSLTVPAKKTVILCHFESQNRNEQAHAAVMKKFPYYRLLRDLPGSVRGMIVNMRAGGGIGGVDLDRSETSDSVLLKSGDPIYGDVKNQSFKVGTLLGELDLPADKVIGMAGGKDGQVRFVLADGQVVSGRSDNDKLQVAISSGGMLRIPFDKIAQWSYRISGKRPNEEKFAGAFAVLRTGDRLRFDAKALAMKFRTRHGVVDLDPGHLLELSMDNPGNAVHRAVFMNGSHLAGFLEPKELELTLQLGPKVTVSRNMLMRMRFAVEDKPDSTLTSVVLTNGDELFGTLTTDKFKLTTDFGAVDVDPAQVKTIHFKPEDLGRIVVQTWKGSTLKGRLGRSQLGFQIAPKTRLSIYAGQFVSITCPLPMPPKVVRGQVEKLVAQLGAESYKDREAATKALVEMGDSIAPLLKGHLKTSDPEVRQRLEDILEQLGVKAGVSPGPIMHLPVRPVWGCKAG